MNRFYVTGFVMALMSFAVSACTASGDHNHDHDQGEHGHTESADHSKFGHLSAIYICGDEEQELQTKHTDEATTLSYLGTTVKASRIVSVVDNAFTGETFKGKFEGQSFVFKGMGYDASITIGGKLTRCEKISCIPLGGPH